MEFTLADVAPPDSAVWVPVVGEQGYQFLLDLYVRSGGTDDLAASIEIGELYEQGIQTADESELLSDVEDFKPDVVSEDIYEDIVTTQVVGWTSVTVSSDYTANSFEFLAATKKATIKLPEYPDDNDIVSVLNVNGKEITTDGNSNLINGVTKVISYKKNTTINYHYFAELESWYMR